MICFCCCRRRTIKSRKSSSVGLNRDDSSLHSNRHLEQSPYYAMRPIGDYFAPPSETTIGDMAVDVINCSVHGPRPARTDHGPQVIAQNHSPAFHRPEPITKLNYSPTDV